MKKIKIDVYGYDILAFECGKDFERYCKREKVEVQTERRYLIDDVNFSMGMAGVLKYQDDEDKGHFFLMVNKKEHYFDDGEFDMYDYLNTVSHEAGHSAYQILHTVGVDHDIDNHEAYTHLLGYITENYLKAFKVFG